MKTNKLKKGFKGMPTQRSKEEVTKDYNVTCAMLGDLYFRANIIQGQINEIGERLNMINAEANSLPKTIEEVTGAPA